MKSREKQWGPFTFLTADAGRRIVPKVGINKVTPKGQRPYRVGLWVSWAGGQVTVARNRWWNRRATWRNQLRCRVGTHIPITHVTKAELLGANPDTAEIRVLDSYVECRRCELSIKGPKWVNR